MTISKLIEMLKNVTFIERKTISILKKGQQFLMLFRIRPPFFQIILKKIHLSMDYGLILTWGVKLKSHDFACDAIFVYKDSRLNESLMENLPVNIFEQILFNWKAFWQPLTE